MEVEVLGVVREGDLAHQTNTSFSDFVSADMEVAVCGLLSDNKVINATFGNDESDAEEVPLRPTVAEALAALSVLENFCFFKNAL